MLILIFVLYQYNVNDISISLLGLEVDDSTRVHLVADLCRL